MAYPRKWSPISYKSSAGQRNAGLKGAASGSLQMQDPKKSPKIAIWAPSQNFVGLYLRN